MSVWLVTVYLVTACAVSAQKSDETVSRIQGLVQKGKLDTAREEVAKAIKSAPNDASLYNLQGVVLAQQADVSGAEKSFKSAIRLDPHSYSIYLNLGHLYQEASKADPLTRSKALDAYASLLRLDPGNAQANYQAAVLLLEKGAFQSSLDHLLRLPAPDQQRAPVLSVLCRDLAGKGDQLRAEETANRLLQSSDLTETDALSILPVLAKAKKNRVLTITLLEGLQARGLAGFPSLQALGLAYKEEGKLDVARSTLEKAAELRPNSVPALISLAQIAYQQHDHDGALGYLAHARDLDPQNGDIHFFWGVICVEQKLTLEAYGALKKAVSLEPENAYFNYAFGAIAIQTDNARESVPYLQKYCELRPQDPRGRLALGVAYFSTGENEKAQQVMSTAAQYPETAATAHYYLGRIANQKGDFSAAVGELQSALQASPNYADAYAEMGLLHLKQKEYRQAEEAFQRALKVDPGHYTANLDLMMLYQRTKDPRAEAQAKRLDKVKEEHIHRTEESLWTIKVQP